MTDGEIVKALAEKVMGWEIGRELDKAERYFSIWPEGRLMRFHVDTMRHSEWNPLTSDADACVVLDKMAETHEVNLVIRHQRPPQADAADYVGCYFGKSDAFLPMSSDARRRVICLAALKAIGVNTE